MTEVVIVDDSRVMRALIDKALIADGDIIVVGTAADAFEARELIRATNPDVITLDVEMPKMDGLEFLRRIMDLRPMPVIMVSTLTSKGTDTTLTALELGAIDFAAKPVTEAAWDAFGKSLRAKVRAAARVRLVPGARPLVPVRPPVSPAPGPSLVGPVGRGDHPTRSWPHVKLIAVGASTGGVTAINRLLAGLPAVMPPMVISQHMPAGFTARFAERLARTTGRDIAEARDGEFLLPGAIRLAPGDRHLRVARSAGRLISRLADQPPIGNYRPSVDALFASVAEECGKRAFGVILTGMGSDGAKGLLQMRHAGARTFGEAEASCIVYGMPKAAMLVGAVGEELPIDDLAAQLSACIDIKSSAA